jgi:hypothetical protein
MALSQIPAPRGQKFSRTAIAKRGGSSRRSLGGGRPSNLTLAHELPLAVSRARGQCKPETFAFLGFTHIFARTREGRRLIRRHTVRERLNAKLRQVKTTLRGMRHLPIPEQGRYLRLVLNGFYNYYAVPTSALSTPALALAALPPAAKPATQADVAEDDADRGALAAQAEAAALAVRRHDPRGTCWIRP